MVTKRELEEEVSVLRDQLTEAASDAVDAGKDAAETARRALAATVEDKKDQLRAYAEAKGLTPDDLKGLGQRLATEIQEMPQKKPLITLLGIFALGVVVGRMSRK
ncbi:MAG: hypothetical protein KDA73_13400 [Rhodobacteraceae bacterium]|nr:hypothetical protein [Paracoccaceae bacterium]